MINDDLEKLELAAQEELLEPRSEAARKHAEAVVKLVERIRELEFAQKRTVAKLFDFEERITKLKDALHSQIFSSLTDNPLMNWASASKIASQKVAEITGEYNNESK